MSRLLAIACVISVKYHYDDYCGNDYYALVAGITLEELNGLEIAFVQAIDYRLAVSAKQYANYSARVQNYANAAHPEDFVACPNALFPRFVGNQSQSR